LVITFGTVLFLFGLKSGVGLLALIPFSFLFLLVLSLSSFGIYTGIRYIKNKGYKQNKQLGLALIVFGVVYLAMELLSYIFSNVTGNSGGELKAVFALLLVCIIVPLGSALKNGCK
jgi:uncharacterized membrane protein YozB (DUF420 family)